MSITPEMIPLLESWDRTSLEPTQESLAYLVINVIMAFICSIIVVMRVYSRIQFSGGLGWDDYWIIIAAPLGMAMLIFQGIVTTAGSGYNLTDVILAGNIKPFLFIVFLFQVVSVSVLGAVKISTCCFYLRVFRGGFMIWSSRIAIALTASFSVSFIFAVCLLCTPISANWDLIVQPTAKCGDQLSMLKGMIATNILLDFGIMLLPLWSVWQLKMRMSEKIGVIACFLIAIVMVVCSIFRLVYVLTVDLQSNITGTVPISVFIGVLEPILAVICVSLPMLRPFYVQWRRNHGGWTGSGSGSGSNSNSHHMKLPGSASAAGALSGSQAKVSAAASKGRSRNMDIELDTVFDDTPDKSGSEENLTDKNGIQVHTKWEVNVA